MTSLHAFSQDRFRQVPVIGILRGIAPQHLAPPP